MLMDLIALKLLREEAIKYPCKVIKFAVCGNGKIFSYNGEFYADCDKCKRSEIEQPYPIMNKTV